MGGFCGYGGSVWVMDEWAVGHWIVGIMSFQKIYGLYGLKHHIVEIRGGLFVCLFVSFVFHAFRSRDCINVELTHMANVF